MNKLKEYTVRLEILRSAYATVKAKSPAEAHKLAKGFNNIYDESTISEEILKVTSVEELK